MLCGQELSTTLLRGQAAAAAVPRRGSPLNPLNTSSLPVAAGSPGTSPRVVSPTAAGAGGSHAVGGRTLSGGPVRHGSRYSNPGTAGGGLASNAAGGIDSPTADHSAGASGNVTGEESASGGGGQRSFSKRWAELAKAILGPGSRSGDDAASGRLVQGGPGPLGEARESLAQWQQVPQPGGAAAGAGGGVGRPVRSSTDLRPSVSHTAGSLDTIDSAEGGMLQAQASAGLLTSPRAPA